MSEDDSNRPQGPERLVRCDVFRGNGRDGNRVFFSGRLPYFARKLTPNGAGKPVRICSGENPTARALPQASGSEQLRQPRKLPFATGGA